MTVSEHNIKFLYTFFHPFSHQNISPLLFKKTGFFTFYSSFVIIILAKEIHPQCRMPVAIFTEIYNKCCIKGKKKRENYQITMKNWDYLKLDINVIEIWKENSQMLNILLLSLGQMDIAHVLLKDLKIRTVWILVDLGFFKPIDIFFKQTSSRL